MAVELKDLTKRSENYSQWYNELVVKADLAEQSAVRGEKFDAAVAEGNKEAAAGTYKVAVKSVDRAAARGLIHKNNAAHKKSAMTVKLNAME